MSSHLPGRHRRRRRHHRREDSWQDVDVFQTYRSNHHKFLDFTSDAAGGSCFSSQVDGRKTVLPHASSSRSHTSGQDDCVNWENWWTTARVAVLLAAVGVVTAFLIAITDYVHVRLKEARVWFVGASLHTYIVFSLLAALGSCVATHALCPAAAGSGVPEMKTILSGVVKPSLLSFNALVAKQIGLVLALAAGLSVGQEGPYVHIACAVADITMRQCACFRAIVVNEAKRLDVLGAACAAGVAASFGTPFGGAIFSIEITATTYNIHMLPLALWCSMAGALALQSAGLDKLTSIFDPDSTGQSKGFSRIDLAAFVSLGAFCGLLGCCFVWAVSVLSAKRNQFLARAIGSRDARDDDELVDEQDDLNYFHDRLRQRRRGGPTRLRRGDSLQCDDDEDDDDAAREKDRDDRQQQYDSNARAPGSAAAAMPSPLQAKKKKSSQLARKSASIDGASGWSAHQQLRSTKAPSEGSSLLSNVRKNGNYQRRQRLRGGSIECDDEGEPRKPRRRERRKKVSFCRRIFGSLLARKMLLVSMVTIVVAPMAFKDLVSGLAGAKGDESGEDVFSVLFAKAPMDSTVRRKLIFYVPYKILATIFSVVLPLPVGVFKPTFTCGAAIGRLFGELLHGFATRLENEKWLATLGADASGIRDDDGLPPSITEFLPWEFAVVGAAAFAAGVTRALSTAVIFLELAGENHLRQPLLIATLVAHFIGNRFTKPIYDALIDSNDTPTLPELPPSKYFQQARNVMMPVASVQELSNRVKAAYAAACAAAHRRKKMKRAALHHNHRGAQPPLAASSAAAAAGSSPSLPVVPPLLEDLEMPSYGGIAAAEDSPQSSSAEQPSDEVSASADNDSRRGGSLDFEEEDDEEEDDDGNDSPRRQDDEDDEAPIPFIRLDSTYAELAKLVALRRKLDYLRNTRSIPVVQDANTIALVGSVLLDDVHSALLSFSKMLAASRRDPILVGAAARRFRRAASGDRFSEHNFDSATSLLHAAAGDRSPLERERYLRKHYNGNLSAAGGTTSPRASNLSPAGGSHSFFGKGSQAAGGGGGGDKLAFTSSPDLRGSVRSTTTTTTSEDEVNDAWRAPVHFVVNHGGQPLPVAADSDRNTHPFFAYAPQVSVLLDASPYQLVDTMDLAKVDLVFRTLKVNNAHVTCAGHLVGVVTRSRLRTYLAQEDFVRPPLDCCHRYCFPSRHRKEEAEEDDYGGARQIDGADVSDDEDDFFVDELPSAQLSRRGSSDERHLPFEHFQVGDYREVA